MESIEPSESGYPEEQPSEVVPEEDREREGTREGPEDDHDDRSRDDDGTATGNPAAG